MSEISVKKFASLDELFEHTGKSIAKIYSGKDHCCRCGCGGKYYYAGSKLFNGMIKRAKKAFEETLEYVNTYCNGDFEKLCREDKDILQGFVYRPGVYVNIPKLSGNNKCYCIYFKNEDED